MPDDVTVPVILIGPGTGVAPFIGFVDHRAELKQRQTEAQFGEVWLFYGCRHKDKDFLFRSVAFFFFQVIKTRILFTSV